MQSFANVPKLKNFVRLTGTNAQQHVAPNKFSAVFWVEEVTVNNNSFLQLQYTQQTDFNFLPRFGEPGLIMWPHINIDMWGKQ